ncbi:MAG: type II toxin-antitoxin system VapC family toxin [Terracidiphilus sp.]
MNVYADSSFLVSPYVQDSHRVDFLARISMRPAIWVTPFHKAEVAHAIYLHVFLKKLSPDAAKNAWSEFQQDCLAGVWISVNLPEAAWETSIDQARKYGPVLGVRTLDSLHVACALELKAERFWTFDERQARLAEAVGLNTTP